ncbi:formyl transferase [Lacipirellula parvula]|uniref:formyl transferase n=1 Tax=Lacipirellula parvula TaxID=2650471 RepID=UPI001E2F3C49|nr:formyl transferase [Lacipirellula parvula]
MPPSLFSPRETRVNIVALSTCTPTNAYLLRSVAERHPISHVFRVAWSEPAAAPASRFAKFRKAPVRSVVELAHRKYLERAHNRREREAMDYLAHLDETVGDIPTTPIDIRQINSRPFAAELRRLNPDVLLVTAAPILKPEIFEIPRLATLNVHRGIAPAYRGERTLFWALANNDVDNVGVTLHRIDRGIDTGAVLKYGYPALAPSDTEATITAKSMRLAAEMIADALDDAEQSGLKGAAQPSVGRCYLAREQRIWQEARYQFLRLLGRRRIKPREQRIVTLAPNREASQPSAEQRAKRHASRVSHATASV